MNFQYEIEPIEIDTKDSTSMIKLMDLSPIEKEIINPIVPPTSGIRMEIFEKKDQVLFMSAKAQFMFFRVFKAVSVIAKTELKKERPNLLLVADDRPSAPHLTEFCARIFAYDGYKIFFQEPYTPKAKEMAQSDPYYSRMGTPHASAAVALSSEIDLVVVLTASHNAIVWNGVKFYIGVPMPISGRLMQSVSLKALELTEIPMNNQINTQYINADKINNDYIIQMVSKIVDISVLKDRKIVFWPYLGAAYEIQDLLTRAGIDLIVIDEDVEPPNPTNFVDHEKVEATMNQHNANLAILMDADRDRIVFIVRNLKTGEFQELSPNELYSAMHNILSKNLNRQLINVRTIPSDPRCDVNANLNLITGVGYKHLGMMVYGAIKEPIDPLKFSTGILYKLEDGKYVKITNVNEIPIAIRDSGLIGETIMVLWEESGGHTFNLIDIQNDGDNFSIKPLLPAIGDKYPAEAVLVLCTLIEQGFNLSDEIDPNVIGTRTTIHAEDEKKMRIINKFAESLGQDFSVGNWQYKIGSFEQVDGKIVIIHLSSSTTDIYFRPSGTGPDVRIYVYGPKSSAQQELDAIKARINEMFP